jgi:catechol 2,3-dioxygenase-like lactoylglutathione lyase family enzyme
MPRTPPQETAASVRYIVGDVADAVRFYTEQLDFTLSIDALPAFAAVTRDGLRLLLSGSASSGGRTLPDGRVPVPGGWNRIVLTVSDLSAEITRLRARGVSFRSDSIVTGPGGSQILVEDPNGNPIELFQPAP